MLVLTRIIPAPAEAVFEAWTDPQIMAQWFFAGVDWSVDVASDFRIGGRFSLTMHGSSGQDLVCTGEYLDIRRPSRLVFTWSSYAVTDTVVIVTLDDLGGTTRLTLEHEGLVDGVIRQRHNDGWGACLTNLTRCLASRHVSTSSG
jgi:glutathione S-transferase